MVVVDELTLGKPYLVLMSIFKKDFDKLESIPRRVKRIIKRLKTRTYGGRVHGQNTSSCQRQGQSDSIMLSKHLHGKQKLEKRGLFCLAEKGITRSRGQKMMLDKIEPKNKINIFNKEGI